MNDRKNDIGVIGLAVMGQNLALNIADHGFKTAVYNRTYAKTINLIENCDSSENISGYEELGDFIHSLSTPRKVVLMIQAGGPTDAIIESLLPLLDEKDILIDGGNAKWTDTIRREKALKEQGILFVGSGVSGGEEGARFGPSLMPGGSQEAWSEISDIWLAISAKVDPVNGKPITGAEPGQPIVEGEPCAAYIGENGAGHYVKMVHNGIEYGDMQMICEAFHILRDVGKLDIREIGKVFKTWNEGLLDSFLIEITADILNQIDPRSQKPFVEVVLDAAGQKGTGKWTSVNALDMGVPASTIAEAVFSRCLSSVKEERILASKQLLTDFTPPPYQGSIDELIDSVRDALYCSKICSYAQGFQLMREAQNEYDWDLNFGEIAQIWRGGCIIRAAFLQKITEAYEKTPSLPNLLTDPYFKDCIEKYHNNWRKVVCLATNSGIPIPTFSSALSYFDGYRSANLPQNLLQAQRDYFGAHSYERVDEERGVFFHLNWTSPERTESKV